MLMAILSVIAGLVFWLGLSEIIHELILANREADEQYKLDKIRGNIDPRDSNI
jgi:hypothetical protein